MTEELNRLPPALRQKDRYLSFKIHSKGDIKLGELVEAVWDSCLRYLGTKETSNADFWIIGNQFNKDKQKGIAKVNREKTSEFRAALALVESIGSQKAFIEVEKVSGSIKNVKDN